MTEQNSSRSNRLFLKIAGRRLRAYSIVTHIGRRSGREYRNPVGAYPLGDGFVIAILYGPESQWVRNVMASGNFTLRTKGRDYQLERPEVIPSSQALAAYPRLWQWILKTQKIDEFVWAHRRASSPPPALHDQVGVLEPVEQQALLVDRQTLETLAAKRNLAT